MADLDRVASIDLISPDGTRVPFGSLWRDRSVVVALVRHFG